MSSNSKTTFVKSISIISMFLHVISFFVFLFLLKKIGPHYVYFYTFLSLPFLFFSLKNIKEIYIIESSISCKLRIFLSMVIPSSFFYFSLYFAKDLVNNDARMIAVPIISLIIAMVPIVYTDLNLKWFSRPEKNKENHLYKTNTIMFSLVVIITGIILSADYFNDNFVESLFGFFKTDIVLPIFIGLSFLSLFKMMRFIDNDVNKT